MSFSEAFFLGIVQGLTEFLPISSSGHLVLFEKFFDLHLNESSLRGFDVVLHFGTLLAIIFYFKNDLLKLFQGLKKAVQSKSSNSEFKLIQTIVLATLPILIAGFFLSDWLDQYSRNINFVAGMFVFTGCILLLSEKFPAQKTNKMIGLKQGFLIGLAQALALMPGLSRSGATISMGMFQGISREASARFAFLMAIPAIFAAMVYVLFEAYLGKVVFPSTMVLLIGFLASLVSSYLCVSFLMSFIRKHSLSVFSIYLFVLSGILLLT